MVESHFQIQLTAILDGLMKTAVSDICALTDSWVQSLQMEIRRSQRENRDLKQKLYSMEQPPPAQTPPEEKSEVEEAPVNTDLTSDSGSEFAAFKRGQWCVMLQKWNPALGGAKAEVMDRSISQIEEEEVDCNTTSNDVVPTPVCEDSKGNPPLYELKTELERTGPGLQNPECSPDVTADFENEHEDPALLDQNNETESTEHFPQPKTEEEDEFDVSCLLMPDLQPSSTQLHRDSHSQSTNPDSNCMSLNFENNFNLSATVPVARRFAKRTSVSLTCEKQIRESFICNICGKTLTAKRSFICHLRLHTGERPFKCIQCGKSFAKKFNLDVHYNVHSGARPYACPLCPRSFADPSAFGRHKMVHRKKLLQDTYSPKSTFVCNICGQSFSSRPSLTLHFRLHAAEKQHSAQKVLYRNVH
ncbi:zinc finger protein 300 isoform X1 [Astyanax mexicanus]|uniref:zinc finger protein 300 isoform X1 n=1 Tax=Astyanax mexicanus TaxID=7994 RepID=UPI0020CB6954|nr:zinc finger protein 300 isoform X1 [Astyanax mexicanus]